MAETKKRRHRVLRMIVAMAVIGGTLGAVGFYVGAGDVVAALLGGGSPSASADSSDTGGLELPEGMSEEFALGLWQHQVASQVNILKLLDREISEFRLTDVTGSSDEVAVVIDATFADGTSAPGELQMTKLGGKWFVSNVRGLRTESTGGMADSVGPAGQEPELPPVTLQDVDIEVLNAVIAAQADSQDVLSDFAEGDARRVVINDVSRGPNTATMQVTVFLDGDSYPAEVVFLTAESDGETLWFIAGLNKK